MAPTLPPDPECDLRPEHNVLGMRAELPFWRAAIERAQVSGSGGCQSLPVGFTVIESTHFTQS